MVNGWSLYNMHANMRRDTEGSKWKRSWPRTDGKLQIDFAVDKYDLVAVSHETDATKAEPYGSISMQFCLTAAAAKESQFWKPNCLFF